MEHKIKLRAKQLTALNNLQSQKKQLSDTFQDLNQKESLIIELLLEENNITNPIASVKLEGEFILIEESETEKSKTRAKVKKLKTEIKENG